ncbi:MAG: hypothetical protein EA420_17900 [Candidatus Competibacteraceae bacterium]|nr:MAG: hypothetical protein EA420_17900 [Candidatus Competibacteraceae bacterium]
MWKKRVLRRYAPPSNRLAAAEAISLQVMPQPLVFACFDRDLNESAANLGIQVLIPTARE